MLFFLLACGDVLTLPSNEPTPNEPVQPGTTLKVRERVPILPGTNSGPPPPEPGITSDQCDDFTDGGPVKGPGCITGTIACGETVIGHTIGGVQRFDSKFYEKKFCNPYLINWDGGDERIYRLTMPDGDWRAIVTLDSPCANLDMAAFDWNEDDCPTINHQIRQCEMFPDNKGKTREKVELTSQKPISWFIVVEGRDNEEGAFSLTVQCRPGIH